MLYHGNSGDSSVANGVVIAMNSTVSVCAPSSVLHRESFGTLRAWDSRWLSSLGLILGIGRDPNDAIAKVHDLGLPTCQASAQQPKKPNVIFVLIDDMGYADLTCYGEKRIHTDQIDRLAAEGIRFTQFYVNAPICSPSRTGWISAG